MGYVRQILNLWEIQLCVILGELYFGQHHEAPFLVVIHTCNDCCFGLRKFGLLCMLLFMHAYYLKK